MIKFNKLFPYGWKIALALALFIYIGTFVDWANVYIKLRNISPVYALFGFVIVAFQAIVLGLRWQCIGKLDRINIPVLAI
jgi:uncharacterized membrane protein YbhN (UPF0104 family)